MAAFVILGYLALRGGGFDTVERQQVTLAIWWLAAVGVLFGVLPRARPSRRGALILVAAGLLAAWTAATLLWTESAERTFVELTRTLDYAGLLALVLFGVHARTWSAAAAGLFASAGVICLVAVLSRLAPDLTPADTVAALFGGERLSYPLDYWNAIAYWSAAVLVAGVGWSAHTENAGGRALLLGAAPVAGLALFLTYSRGGALVGMAALIVVVAASRMRRIAAFHAALALVLTAAVCGLAASQPQIADGTGGGGGSLVALGLLAACLTAGWVGARTAHARPRRRRVDAKRRRDASPIGAREKERSTRRRWIAVGGATITLVVAGALLVSAIDPRLSRTPYDPGSGDAASRLVNLSDGRGDLYASALEAFSSEPVLGIGAGTYGLWHERSRPAADRVQDAHSLFLESLGEMGLPGLLLVVTLMAGLAIFAAMAARGLSGNERYGGGLAMCAIFGVVVTGSAIDWLWEVFAVTVLGLAAAGAILASGGRARRSRRLTLGRGGAAVLLILAGALHVPPIVSSERVEAARSQLALGDERRALELANEAVDAQPWSATAHVARALVQIEAGKLDAAAADAAEAARLEPTNFRHGQLQRRIAALEQKEDTIDALAGDSQELTPASDAAP